jgi:hypothetical protein
VWVPRRRPRCHTRARSPHWDGAGPATRLGSALQRRPTTMGEAPQTLFAGPRPRFNARSAAKCFLRARGFTCGGQPAATCRAPPSPPRGGCSPALLTTGHLTGHAAAPLLLVAHPSRLPVRRCRVVLGPSARSPSHPALGGCSDEGVRSRRRRASHPLMGDAPARAHEVSSKRRGRDLDGQGWTR